MEVRSAGSHCRFARLGWGLMNVQEALDAWQAQYTGQPPVGFMLRFSHDAVWTRLNSLGERDEATDSAVAQAAARFDAVASALFTGATVLVLALEIEPSEDDVAMLRTLGIDPMTPPDSWIEALSAYLPDPGRVEYRATTLTWRRGCLDTLWLAVANDLIGRIAVFCPATGDAFLPYGGLADLFIWGTDRRAKVRDRFREWLPNGTSTAAPTRVLAGARRG